MLDIFFVIMLSSQLEYKPLNIDTNIEPYYREPSEKNIHFGYDWKQNFVSMLKGKDEWWKHYRLIIDF